MRQYRILCFGDSIVFGAWDEYGAGWADMLRQKLHSEYLQGGIKTQVFNLGVGAEMSDGLLKRIENEIIARSNPSWELIILISTGANDSRAKSNLTNFESNPKDYEKNLNKILTLAKQYSQKVLIVGLHAVNEKLAFKDLYYSNERFMLFDHVNKILANKHNIPRVDLHKELLGHRKFEKLYHDMIHPNHDGHKWIFDKVLPEVKKLMKI